PLVAREELDLLADRFGEQAPVFLGDQPRRRRRALVAADVAVVDRRVDGGHVDQALLEGPRAAPPREAPLLGERQDRPPPRADEAPQRVRAAGARVGEGGALERGGDAAPAPVGGDAGDRVPDLAGSPLMRLEEAHVALALDGDEAAVAEDVRPVEPQGLLARVEARRAPPAALQSGAPAVGVLPAPRDARPPRRPRA